jgi:hypothetical protein
MIALSERTLLQTSYAASVATQAIWLEIVRKNVVLLDAEATTIQTQLLPQDMIHTANLLHDSLLAIVSTVIMKRSCRISQELLVGTVVLEIISQVLLHHREPNVRGKRRVELLQRIKLLLGRDLSKVATWVVAVVHGRIATMGTITMDTTTTIIVMAVELVEMLPRGNSKINPPISHHLPLLVVINMAGTTAMDIILKALLVCHQD